MKKIIYLGIIVAITLCVASCKSSKKCPAYSFQKANTEQVVKA